MQADKTKGKRARQARSAKVVGRVSEERLSKDDSRPGEKKSDGIFSYSDRIGRVFTSQDEDVYSLVNWSRRSLKMIDHTRDKVVYEAENLEFPSSWSENAEDSKQHDRKLFPNDPDVLHVRLYPPQF